MSGASNLPTLVRRYSFTDDDDGDGAPSTIRVLIRRYSLSSDHEEGNGGEPDIDQTQSDGELEMHIKTENSLHELQTHMTMLNHRHQEEQRLLEEEEQRKQRDYAMKELQAMEEQEDLPVCNDYEQECNTQGGGGERSGSKIKEDEKENERRAGFLLCGKKSEEEEDEDGVGGASDDDVDCCATGIASESDQV